MAGVILGDVEVPSEGELLSLSSRVLDQARRRGLTVATAESCTGGLVASALTDVPGSSDVVRGGVVSYAIDVKRSVLGVSGEVLDAPGVGAVSSECASAMCEGARRVLGASLAVSTTGIAGPGGEEPGKPVGTVWFGISSEGGTHTRCHYFSGSRSEVRKKAVGVALELLAACLDD